MKKIFIILLLVLSITNIKAYENDYFKIDIPDDFKEEQIEDNVYKWTKDNKYIIDEKEEENRRKIILEKFNKLKRNSKY